MVDLNYTCELPGSRFHFNTGFARILWGLAGFFLTGLSLGSVSVDLRVLTWSLYRFTSLFIIVASLAVSAES